MRRYSDECVLGLMRVHLADEAVTAGKASKTRARNKVRKVE
jgi:hypothetical protein